MRMQTYLFILALILPLLQCKPGHMVHDFYKCESDYYRMNFEHCRERLRKLGSHKEQRVEVLLKEPAVIEIISERAIEIMNNRVITLLNQHLIELINMRADTEEGGIQEVVK